MVRSFDFFEAWQQDRDPRKVRQREVLRVAATLRAENAADIARREVLRWAAKRVGGPLPREAWDFQAFQCPVAGRECAAVRMVNGGKDIWAIRAIDPDKNIAQRTWATEVVIGYYDQKAYFSLRLLMSSNEQEPRIEPAVPGLLRQLVKPHIGLIQGAEVVGDEPINVESEGDAELFVHGLIDPNRKIPHVVLTVPTDRDDPNDPLLDAGFLAHVTVGIAKIIVVPARFTWIITEQLGKRLSVFNGAVRVYLPGFTEDANPYEHKLFARPRLTASPRGLVDQEDNTQVILQRMIARASLRQFGLGREVLAYETVRDIYHEQNQKKLEDAATDKDRLNAALEQIESLRENLKKTKTENEWFAQQHDDVEAHARELKERLHAAAARNQALTEQLRSAGRKPDSNVDPPEDWHQFSDWCDEHFNGRVTILSAARKEIKKAKFKDVSLAARCVIWLANDYREKRQRGDGNRLEINLDGVRNALCGADGFEVKWRGESCKVDWHIKTGGNTRNPLRCLRIYYFWHEESQQVVIASMPAHRRTDAT